MLFLIDELEEIRAFFNYHRVLARMLLLSLLVFVLFACLQVGSKHEQAGASYVSLDEVRREGSTAAVFSYLAENELDAETDPASAELVELGEVGGNLEITRGGAYRLAGRLDGKVQIRADEQLVHLYLDNAEISSKNGAAIYVEEALKLVITLLPGTENSISDSGYYRETPNEKACIDSAADLTINGTGRLRISGLYGDGIRTRDVLRILGGEISLKCKKSALRGNDGILITAGSLFLSSEKNGMKTTKSGDGGRGNIVIKGGEMSMISGGYTFVCEKGALYIYDCSIKETHVASTYSVRGGTNVVEGCIQ